VLLRLQRRQEGRFRSNRELAIDWIHDQIEALERDLAKQGLAARRTDQAIGVHRPPKRRQHERPRDCHLDLLIVGQCDHRVVDRTEAECLNHVLRQKGEDCACVNQ
jgi:hypothetical protein